VQEPYVLRESAERYAFGAAAVKTSSPRMVLAQSECRWALRVLGGIVFPEVVALKTDDVSDQ
jgi:hypothetical protein